MKHSNPALPAFCATDVSMVLVFQLATTGEVSTDLDMDNSSVKRTIIFSPKICDNVDLLAGNIIHIFPPWKEVKVKEETVILCTYFSHRGV